MRAPLRDAWAMYGLCCWTSNPTAQFSVGRQVKVNVRLDASLAVDQPFERVLRVDVIDQGVGIKEEDQERIFDPYVRVAPSENGGGTGLGLHSASSSPHGILTDECISHSPGLVRRVSFLVLLLTSTHLLMYLAVARALGGGISVASAIGLGSTFTMTVPLHVLSDAEAAQPRPPPVTVVVPSDTVPGPKGGIDGREASGRRSSSSHRTEEPPSPADYVCEPVASPRSSADDEAAMRVLADVIGNARDGAVSLAGRVFMTSFILSHLSFSRQCLSLRWKERSRAPR